MWRSISGGRCSEKKIQRRGQLAAVALLLLDVAIPSPSSHGWIARATLPIHQLIPVGVPSLSAMALLLAACYWLFRSPAE
jgi:hypothetical protein